MYLLCFVIGVIVVVIIVIVFVVANTYPNRHAVDLLVELGPLEDWVHGRDTHQGHQVTGYY